jgi:hypothetical protein
VKGLGSRRSGVDRRRGAVVENRRFDVAFLLIRTYSNRPCFDPGDIREWDVFEARAVCAAVSRLERSSLDSESALDSALMTV